MSMSTSNSQKGSSLLLSLAISLSLAGAVAPANFVQPCMAAPPPAWVNSEDSFLKRGKRDYNNGLFDQALRDFNECLRINPRRSEALYWRSMVHSALKNTNEALADLDQGIRVDPNNAVFFLNRGLIYSNQGKHESALSDFNEALRLDSSLADARTNRDFCLKELEKTKVAQKTADPSTGSSSTSSTTSPATTASGTTGSASVHIASGTTSNLTTSSGYTPYTGKPSARLAALQKEEREAEARLAREKAEADKFASARERAEARAAELALHNKEVEVRLEEARLKREEAQLQKLAKLKETEEALKKQKNSAAQPDKTKIAVAAPAPKAEDDDPLEVVNRPVRDKWALVVGISEFQDKTLNLHYPAKDAADFASFLTSEGNFAKDHVKLLTNQSATVGNIMSELGDTWLPHVANPDDLVLIYISSHGSPSEMDTSGENYLIAYDTKIDHLFTTGVSMQDLTRTIKKRVHSDRVVVVLDACHSGATEVGGAKGLTRTKNVDAEAIAQGSGQLVITSSSNDQVSWESKKYQNSVFTRCLIDSLRKNGSGTTLGDAFQSLKDQVQAQVLSERGVLQTPVLKSKWKGGDLRISAPATASAPPKVGG